MDGALVEFSMVVYVDDILVGCDRENFELLRQDLALLFLTEILEEGGITRWSFERNSQGGTSKSSKAAHTQRVVENFAVN